MNHKHNIPEEIRNSAERIMNFAGLSSERAYMFKLYLNELRKLQDSFSQDKEIEKIKAAMLPDFYQIYTSVLKRASSENKQDRLLQMFLQFGYIDENLLSTEQTIELYELVDNPVISHKYPVYNAQNWLGKIYSREKEPSVNEYGQDYFDVFREKKKRGELNEKDKPAYENDINGRLDHEVNNLLRLGQRLCFGRMSGYLPILHRSMITGKLSSNIVTPEKIEASVDKILNIDFSAFHREIVYNQPDKKIVKELIMKSVVPDFILLPIFGSRAVMWQELTGRVRNSPGRFVFPMFTDENLDKMMIGVIARFRWDLSKTMSGYARNDNDPGSLTSDYIDYIQFYKKNRDLSGDAKEKIKNQIDRYRNNTGEIFAADYQTWINFESRGLIRLNKVARDILFRHCPFSRSIREQLEKQPLYSAIINRFDNIRSKHARVIEAHYSKLVTPGVPLDVELMRNLRFYKM